MAEDINENAGRKTPSGIEKKFEKFDEWVDDSWAMKKAQPLLKRHPKITVLITWLLRIAIGGIFLISGFSKGIDPWGTFYKTTEYLVAMHLPMSEWGNAMIAPVFMLFTVEFLLGLSLLLGCYRKTAPIMVAIVMLFMLPLTLWIAISDPVSDCGCFGDLFVISNWATFIKNCLISLGVVWLLKFNAKASCLIRPSVQWIATTAAAVYILIVGYIGYWQQPMLDFRPYKIGTVLLADENSEEYTPHYAFYYEKNGEVRRFDEDDTLPDDSEGWKFVRREETGFVKKQNAGSSETSSHADFRIWSEDGEEDVTESLAGYDRQLMLLVPDINSLSMSSGWKINKLFDLAEANETDFFAVVAGSPEVIEEWRDLTSGQYPIYTAEDTSIKEVARGNPSLVSLEEGVIVWKSALSAFRIDDDADSSEEIQTAPVSKSMTGGEALGMLTIGLVLLLTILMVGSVATLLTRRINSKKNKEENSKTPES